MPLTSAQKAWIVSGMVITLFYICCCVNTVVYDFICNPPEVCGEQY